MGRATDRHSVRSVLDPTSYVPVSRQLADLLRGQIGDGTLGPGEQLLGEVLMARRYGVSRETVRAALVELRAEGLVETIKSRGTRVRPEPVLDDWSLQRGSRVRLRMPTPAERREHGIPEGVPVAVVRHGARTVLLIGDRHELVVK